MKHQVFATTLTSLFLWHGALSTPASATPADSLTTAAERSGFQRTGRYEEVGDLCRNFEAKFPKAAKCFSFGQTPEGRPMWALAASSDGVLTAAQARERKRPVILAQGGIHAGEIDGKDAGFLVLREMLTDSRSGALGEVTFVFVPVFSPDGHERFGRWNRPNQVGPEEMGWRTTAQNYNLNRDYTKADAPEMQAMLRLLNQWDPVVYVDLHVTDGAQFEHDVAILSEPRQGGDAQVAALAAGIRDSILRRIAAQGSKPLSFYPSFDVADNPASGITDYPPPARFSTGYWALSNRVALLVETHSWKDYPTRVRVTANILRALFDAASRDASGWRATMIEADQRATRLAGERFPLSFGVTDEVRHVDFAGYAYERTPSPISGTVMTRYDTSRPQTWRMPLRDRARVLSGADVPLGGYLIPPAVAAWLVPKLNEHGIRTERTRPSDALVSVSAWRASKVTIDPQTFEGHARFTLEGSWTPESHAVPAGTVFVPIAQPKARLVVTLLEPTGPDSYAAWGFFATAFEKKEYMEPYVAERVAQQMLEANAQLREEFARRLANDKAFASDPDARLEFFHRRHSSWDDRYNLYPVFRLER